MSVKCQAGLDTEKRPPIGAPSIQALAEFLDDLPQVACVLFDEPPCFLQA
jgi:hypothetical protein